VASSTSSAPFLAALPELDAAPPPVIDNNNQAEERRGGDGLKEEAKEEAKSSSCGLTVAAGRPTLWLRGLEQPVLEALEMLGAAVARNFALPENEKSFIGRLGRVKLDLTQVLPSAPGRKSLKEFQAHAAFKLREERLGKDAKLGMHLDVEAKSKKKSGGAEELELMCLFDFNPLTVGFEGARGLSCAVLRRNMTIPCRKTARLKWDDATKAFMPASLSDDDGASSTRSAAAAEEEPSSIAVRKLRAFAGERAFVEDNLLLDEVDVLAGSAPVEVVFDIDANGVIRINGAEIRGHNTQHDFVARVVAEAEAFAAEDHTRQQALLEELHISGLASGARLLGADWNLDSLP
jgi:hypothetical protein